MIAINMEMPKSCWNCNFCCKKDGYYCAINNNHLAMKVTDIPNENRPDDCPLVEIVTCKDCKHRDPEDKFCDCGHMIKWSSSREDNWYCADGERRE